MAGATANRESRQAHASSGGGKYLSCCCVGITFAMTVCFFLSIGSLINLTKCRTLLPATCQVTNTTKHPRTVIVTPQNGDMRFSHLITAMPERLENGNKVQCFYCNAIFRTLQFDSDRKKILFSDYVYPVLFSVGIVILCSCCCLCIKPSRRDGEERDPEPKDTNMNTSKKSESGTTHLSDSEYKDSTMLSETIDDSKKSTDGSGSLGV